MCRYGDIWLVGGFNPSEKYESQLGLLFPIYGKMEKMFQTTNQMEIYRRIRMRIWILRY